MIRKASLEDPPAILDLVNTFAARDMMLPRSLHDTYENIRDFFVCEESGRIVGCAALHVSWEGLGEIRSLAVRDECQHKGVGSRLVKACLKEARKLGMRKVFTLTYVPDFFRRHGFKGYPKDKLPHKVWSDCLNCPKFPDCDEVAMLIDLTETK